MLKIKISKFNIHKYILIGIITVGIDYTSIFISYNIFKLNYIVAVVNGFILSSLFQFYANYYYTFKLTKNDALYRRMMVYFFVVIVGMLIGTMAIVIIKKLINSLYAAKTISLFISFSYGFLLSKNLIFKKNRN